MTPMSTDKAFCDREKFPFKLHKMLEILEEKGDDRVVGWNPDGRSFRINKPTELVHKVLPDYFHQTKYKSFQRQLNIYGFKRIGSGKYKGSYFHKDFIRSKPPLSHEIQRKPQASERPRDELKPSPNASIEHDIPPVQAFSLNQAYCPWRANMAVAPVSRLPCFPMGVLSASPFVSPPTYRRVVSLPLVSPTSSQKGDAFPDETLSEFPRADAGDVLSSSERSMMMELDIISTDGDESVSSVEIDDDLTRVSCFDIFEECPKFVFVKR